MADVRHVRLARTFEVLVGGAVRRVELGVRVVVRRVLGRVLLDLVERALGRRLEERQERRVLLVLFLNSRFPFLIIFHFLFN